MIDLVGFRDTVWGVLTGQGTDNLTGLVMHEVKEIETWVLRLLSAPVPVPGKTRVEVILLLMMLVDNTCVWLRGCKLDYVNIWDFDWFFVTKLQTVIISYIIFRFSPTPCNK